MTREEAAKEIYKRHCTENRFCHDDCMYSENACPYGMAIAALQEPERKWIPVSERLPEEANYYEITVDFGSEQITKTAFYSVHESRWDTYTNYVTAWRERLAEPYKAGNKE